MIPQFPNAHPVFDEWPIKQNYECPVSKSRLRLLQKQIDRLAGVALNGKSNVRVIWAADPAVAMHMVGDEPKARYALRTEQYECSRTDAETGLLVVEFVDVDIVPPRFIFEQYHTPEEQAFNPASPQLGDNEGYYTHLFTVAFHDETCCDGREAVNGQICLGAYQEPGEQHLNYLRMLVRLRDEAQRHRAIGQPLTLAELQEDQRRLKTWNESRDAAMLEGYETAAKDSLRLHAWRASNADAGKRSKFQFLNPEFRKGLHY